MASVSIALTTYNGLRYLRPQLDSLVTQTRAPLEIVIRDDGSSDGTPDLLRNFAATSPVPMRILTEGGRLGPFDNFLLTAAQCRGDFVAFCDQDDVWLPHKLETCVAALAKHDALFAMHSSWVTDERLERRYVGRQGIRASEAFEPLTLNPHENGWGHQMLFRRDLADLIPPAARPKGPRGGLLPHDIWIYVLAAALGRVVHIDEPLVLYRQHGSNTDGAGRQPLRQRLAALLDAPIDRYEYRLGFCTEMAQLLAGLESHSDSTIAPAAARAAEVYRRRAEGIAARIDLYRQKSLRSRLTAFRKTMMANDYEDARLFSARVSSRAKDFVLGVAGLGNTTDTMAGPAVRS